VIQANFKLISSRKGKMKIGDESNDQCILLFIYQQDLPLPIKLKQFELTFKKQT